MRMWMYLAAGINMLGSLYYAWNTIRGRTQPHRITWTLWVVIAVVVVVGMLMQGVRFRDTLFVASAGFGPFIVVTASFFSATGVWNITAFDWACGVVSLLGAIALVFLRNGNTAIALSIGADILAVIPTLLKSYRAPHTESAPTYVLALFASFIALLHVPVWDFAHTAFTFYVVVCDTVVLLLILTHLGPRLARRHQVTTGMAQ